tara:strand:- start:958 stop:1995 length:1038 start_codon:yes stop_codon:yes gene_type:complete
MNLLSDFQVSIYTASATAFVISSILCFSIIKYNKNFITKSNNQKRLNTLNIVPLGGVAMAISFFISVRLLGEADSNIVSISVFALAISILGVVDDFLNLNWKLKIIFQFLFVGLPIYLLNQTINFEIFLGVDFSGRLNLIFTILWIIILMNSLNFIDNMDGFAALNSSFICLALTVLSFVYNQNYLADISFILLFTILAFTIFNFPPAKIYMGDSGSLFIGFIFGFISILFDWNPTGESYLYSSIAPVFLFFTIPLLDFSTVFVYRIKNRISPATGGTDHISHRLLNQGYSIKSILLMFSFLNIFIFVLITLTILFEFLSVIIFVIYLVTIIILFLNFQKMQPLN